MAPVGNNVIALDQEVISYVTHSVGRLEKITEYM